MVTSVDHDQNSGSMGESQLWGDLTNLDNIGGSSKRNLDMNSLNRNEVINEGGVVLVNGKPSRERRKKIRNMFASLHALLPDLPSKVDKSTIVDAAVKEIKNLQQILENLEKKKKDKLRSMSPFVTQFCICATKKQRVLTKIAFVLEKHMIDVVSINIIRNGIGNVYMILVHASKGSYDTNSMEKTYKQAAGEILMLIS
ncbi:hypothetical protein KIW84_072270 [Lathyrus oleraceus]|uniref:BHLH domain-containing protein n=1 Tax=Pisum sativum TaxID=3888 RepID=A0A9D4VN04_PEA|nr:hypothetical protein KIW84_072270 [Pisum sativum]